MATQGYPDGYYAQRPHNLSKDQYGQDTTGDESQRHAGPARYQYNYPITPFGGYGLQIGAGASGEPRPVGCLLGGADDLGSHHAVGDLSKTNSDYDWGQQQQDLAAGGAGSARVLPVLGAVSMNRAAVNSIPPNQGYIDPNVPLIEFHNLNYPNRQGNPHLAEGVPPLAPQLGTADAEYYVQYSDQGAADMLSHNMLPKADVDGYGASALEISEGVGSGGEGAFTSIGGVSDLNESELGPWTTSAVVAGEYGVQQEFTQGVQPSQPSYDLRTGEYAQPDGVHGAFKFCHWS
jgi:hypothetical protein